MKIYHGSLVVVDKPEIRKSDRFLDFGYGFYTTSNFEQAKTWCDKLCKRNNVKSGYITEYDFDFEVAKRQIEIIEFAGANQKWLKFVCDNRKGKCYKEYDLVMGPVADDSVFEVVRFYELGTYDLQETLKRLKVEKLFNQILFHTEKSLKFLTYKSFVESNYGN